MKTLYSISLGLLHPILTTFMSIRGFVNLTVGFMAYEGNEPSHEMRVASVPTGPSLAHRECVLRDLTFVDCKP